MIHMGIAYQGYCYPDSSEAMIAIQANYSHEHNPAYTLIIPSVNGSTINLSHYKAQGGTLIPDTAIPSYSLPECLTPGPLNSIAYGIDWSVVEWIFGAGLVMFATGAAIGSIINVVRKTRV